MLGTVDRLRDKRDVRRDEADRYGLYRLRGGEHQELSTTSRDGIGTALVQHVIEGDLTPDDGFGLLDRLTRAWLVNPWGKR